MVRTLTLLDQIATYDERTLERIDQNARRLVVTGTDDQKASAGIVLVALEAELQRRKGTLSASSSSTHKISGPKKHCKICGVEKPLNIEYFGRANGGSNWQPHCRACGTERSKKHRERNKEKLAAYDKMRRERDNRPTFSNDQKLEIWQRHAGICLCCANPIFESDIPKSQVDHIIPINRGGGHETSNLALAHSRCNSDKHNKTLEEHWGWRFRSGLDTTQIDRAKLDLVIETNRVRVTIK